MSKNDQIILSAILSENRNKRAAHLNESEFFELFSAEQLLKDYDLSYDELNAGLIGGGGDGGIDAIYIFVNGELIREDSDLSQFKKDVTLELIIIQAKTSPSFTETSVDKLIAVSEDLLDLSKDLNLFKAVYNADIVTMFDVFRETCTKLATRFPTLKIKYYYTSTGTDVHPNVGRKARVLETKVNLLFSNAFVSMAFVGAADLLKLARQLPLTSYILALAESPISSTGDVGFICLVKLTDYYNFITDGSQLRRQLFEANVRDYQGDTEVNQEIQISLREKNREDFWWLNNGVTIVAAKAVQSGKSLTIEDPQVVNGLQTSTVIFDYFKNSGIVDDSRNLLVRVIVPTITDSRDRIIKATNSQTYVPPASLYATDKIQRDIEEFLRPHNLFYDRRKNFHKNQGRPVDKIISISTMAQAIMAIYLLQPDAARARPSSLLKVNSAYNKVFDVSNPLDLYKNCITVVQLVEAQMKVIGGVSAKDRNNIKYYVAMHLVICITRKLHPTADEISKLSEVLPLDILTSISCVKDIYEELGASDQIAKGSDFLRRVKEDLSARLVSPENFVLESEHH